MIAFAESRTQAKNKVVSVENLEPVRAALLLKPKDLRIGRTVNDESNNLAIVSGTMTYFVKTFLKKECDFIWDTDFKAWIKKTPTEDEYNAAKDDVRELAEAWGLTFIAED